MKNKTHDRRLRIVIGPDRESRGTAWYVDENTVEGPSSVASGGSARRPKGVSEDHWLGAARRLVSADVKGIRWAGAVCTPYGYSDGADYCPSGVRIDAWQRVTDGT